jgi:hypothetical protein
MVLQSCAGFAATVSAACVARIADDPAPVALSHAWARRLPVSARILTYSKVLSLSVVSKTLADSHRQCTLLLLVMLTVCGARKNACLAVVARQDSLGLHMAVVQVMYRASVVC